MKLQIPRIPRGPLNLDGDILKQTAAMLNRARIPLKRILTRSTIRHLVNLTKAQHDNKD